MKSRSRSVVITVVTIMSLVLGGFPAFAHGPGGEEELAMDVAIKSASRVPRTGRLVVQGTLTCSEAAEAEVTVYAEQTVGRFGLVEGGSYSQGLRCTPQGSSFSATLSAHRGMRFQPGKVTIFAEAFACSPEIPNWEDEGPVGEDGPPGEMPEITCGFDFQDATMRVKTLRW